MSLVSNCPCGSGRIYAQCCEIFHGGVAAETAETLMRSRYSAYVLSCENYLLATWHPDTRPPSLSLNTEKPARWLGLKILRHDNIDDTHAIVEFVARFRQGGTGKGSGAAQRLHECSRFVREEGRWLYVDGDIF